MTMKLYECILKHVSRSSRFTLERNFATTISKANQTDTGKVNDFGDEEKTTHFGFKTIKESEKEKEDMGRIPLLLQVPPKQALPIQLTWDDVTSRVLTVISELAHVRTVFENVADSYDVMNDAMSLGIHRIWKDIFIQELGPTHGSRLLDSAGGTGDITFRYLNYLNNLSNPKGIKSHVTVSDINQNMLDVGKARAKRHGFTTENGYDIAWLQGDAEKLPCPDESFNAYTIAFGIRNVTHIDKVLEDAYRILQPGGRFMCLEFSHLNNNTLQWAYDQYSFQMIPVLGTLIAGQWEPYQYLVESIRKFPKQEDFKDMIENAGFRQVSYKNLTFGVVAIHSGFKI